MKTFVTLSIIGLILLLGCAMLQSAAIAQSARELTEPGILAGPPPSSLDNLYPPGADTPVYQIKMFAMEAPFTGIAIETGRGNIDEARNYFEKFRAQYLEVSRMVPEWEKAYPLKPLEELQASLQTGERDKIMAAFGIVAQACNECHFVYMPKVQHRYHWPDSSRIDVSDPVTKESLKYSQFMTYLNVSFVGIGLDLAQGRPDNALKNFEAFDARYQTLKKTCEACHETERKYYVDDSIQTLIGELGAALRIAAPDAKAVEALSRQIGTESCLKCHWVHIPATYSKIIWQNREIAGKE